MARGRPVPAWPGRPICPSRRPTDLVRRAAALAEMPKTAAALAVGKISVEHVDLLARAAGAAHRRQYFTATKPSSSAIASSWPSGRRTRRSSIGSLGSTGSPATMTDPNRGGGTVKPPSIAASTAKSTLDAIFDPVGGATFIEAWDRIDNELRLADHDDPDAPLRTRTQRRLDALVEMAIRATTNGAGGRRPAAAGHRRRRRSQVPPTVRTVRRHRRRVQVNWSPTSVISTSTRSSSTDRSTPSPRNDHPRLRRPAPPGHRSP